MNRTLLPHFILGLLCFVMDRLTKMWAVKCCAVTYCVTSWLCIELAINKGIAWSIGDTCWPVVVMILTTAIALCTIAAGLYYVKYYRISLAYPLVFIMSGAMGNIVDRWVYGGVIDFIVLHYDGWYFPTFNIADVAICWGAFLWVIKDIQARANYE